MGEGKWIKTYVNTYDDTPSKMIDSREDRDVIHYVRGRLLALAGKVNRNGELYMTETKPYTIKTLAIEFNRDFETVKEAIKVLKSLEVIEITEDKVLKISDWEMDQNVEGLERIRKQTSERVARHRAAKKAAEDNEQSQEGNKNKKLHKKNNEIKEESLENDESANVEDNQEGKQDVIESKESLNKMHDIETDNVDSENTEHNVNNHDLKCNVTVTQQNKRKGRRRGKKKDKRESKKKENNSLIEFSCDNDEFEISDESSEDLFCESFESEESGFYDYIDSNDNTIFFDVSDSNKAEEESVICFEYSNMSRSNEQLENNPEMSDSVDRSEESAKLLFEYCSNTAMHMPSNISLNSLKYAVKAHAKKYVKMAIDKAIEVGKFDMAYINGILNNWKREGYPGDEYKGGNINGRNSYGKGNIQDTVKFEGFKPKEPRKLTEGERQIAEKNLI